ncbi:Leucine-rich repeat structural protein ORF147 [Gossypium australe]|uniref:Leucine-rich repeat structural protein ORF147 n=1 Tax=Gossypium australe TaxID=47621 RepID=A0A5B6X069_9ROSI|nr:Leucine-rich repeat structural protein ORF147 [Gossypium australe]
MGKLIEEKALDQKLNGHQHRDHDHARQKPGLNNNYNNKSLEEKVSEFLYNDFAESDGNCVNDATTDGYGSDGNESNDSIQHTLYWESQQALLQLHEDVMLKIEYRNQSEIRVALQEILERYMLIGSKLRQEVNGTIEEAKETEFCSCINQYQTLSFDIGCINCLRKRVINLLCQKGLKATLCVSKWKHTKNYPAGSHEYIEVMASTQGRKKQIPLVIELEFRDQFEIAKACDEYMKLVDKLPLCYVGKTEYLNPIVGVMCDAAKRSMEERKLHMGPWRKRSFMQMKWSGTSERRSLNDEPSRQLLHQYCSKSSKPAAAGIISKRKLDTSC